MTPYNIKRTEYPARPRSKRMRESGFIYSDGGIASSTINSGSATIDANFDIFEGKGILVNKDTTENLSYTISHGKTSETGNTENENAFIIQNLEFDDFGHVQKAHSVNATDLLDDIYLRKDRDDTAHGNITFEKDIYVNKLSSLSEVSIGESIYSNKKGASYKEDGFFLGTDGKLWITDEYIKRNAYFNDSLSSPIFFSGFPNGTGWKLAPYTIVNAAETEEQKYRLEIDDITVRGKLRAYEMIISQLRGENDNVIFAGMMKVRKIDAKTNIIFLDTEEGITYNPFREGDVLMVQRYNGKPAPENNHNVIKQYELRVIEAGIGNDSDGKDRVDYIRFSHLVGNSEDIAKGDVLTRVDNISDSTRKGLVKITTIDEWGAPYIDVVYGMKTDPLNSVKARIGNLEGITVPQWGELKGYGIYCQNFYGVGEFRMKNGKDVQMEFEVLEDKFRSEFSSIRSDISQKDNFLQNSSFAISLKYWQCENDIRLFTANRKFLYFNDNFYSEKRKVSEIVEDQGRTVLRIKNNSILQSNEDLYDKPTDETTCYISFRYKCKRAGQLTIGIQGQSLFFSEYINESKEYDIKEFEGKWDGLGDFTLSFSGEILIYNLAISNNKLADLENKLTTRILQTEESISAIALRVNAIEEASSGWLTTAEGNLIWAGINSKINSDANLISIINQTPYNTLIASSRINLAGAVSFTSLASDLQSKFNLVDDMAKDNKLTPNEKQIVAKDYITIIEEYKVLLAKKNKCTNSYFNGDVNIQWNGYNAAYSRFYDNAFRWLMNMNSTTDIDASVFRKTYADYYSAKEALNSELAYYDACISKNDIAYKLGYTDYAQLIKDAEAGKTFIKGGYINTELIHADKLFANMVITNGAKIGEFTISSDTLRSDSMSINNNGIAFSRNNLYAGFGASSGPATIGIDVPVWVRNHVTDYTPAYGIYVSAKSLYYDKNYAITIGSGFISGFAIKPNRISSSTTLTNDDVYVTCYNKSDINVTLPSSPNPGKLIYIRKMNSSQVTVKGNGIPIAEGTTETQSKTWASVGDCGVFFYDGLYWCFNYMVR